SRNRYLGEAERRAALALSGALAAAAEAGGAGRDAALAAARAELDAVGAAVDYVAIVDPATFMAVDESFAGEALALVAARIGTTRLIDNRRLTLGA
ncbi:MAG: 4-phosphopantoate--beta-alanine ligase, partial [Microbacteriaceae bacterium]|nr:4-phosphopantoate--beta-alanine ligase [Microbacteriaceae bacterium]